jgi:hypothetical protein
MSDRTPDTPENPTAAPEQDAINQSRRKLTGAALGASAIFTLASRPVLAGQCMTPSAAVSGNLSQHGTPITCSGRTPGYWKTHYAPGSWPSPYLPGGCNGGQNMCNKVQNWSGGTLFHPLFSGTQFMANLDGNPGTPNTSLSMMQVMMLNDGSNPWGLTDPDNLGAHIVAALLNASVVPSLTPVLSAADVINMWNEWASKGYFEPTANVKWNSAQIVDYLKTTMI